MEGPMSQQAVLSQVDARGVATVTLNRPEVNNAYDETLIQEAGGLVGDLQGNPGYLDKGEIAAGTPKVLPQLLDALK